MDIYLSVFFSLLTLCVSAQRVDELAIKEIEAHREKQRMEFLDPTESPLKPRDLKHFSDLDYFPIDLKYRVAASYKEHDAKKFVSIKTTTNRLPEYVRFAELTFDIEGRTYTLQAYQNQELLTDPEYTDYLFIPFNDGTNGDETYGGGRYIDFRIPSKGEAILDFNQCYNPYCCYNGKYSCPIPPQENYLPVKIQAGVKDFKKPKKRK